MKNFLLTIICCFFAAQTFAQSTPQNLSVKGIAIDSLSGKPMGFVTVALQAAGTGVPVKSNLTKDDGSFELKAPAAPYQLVLVFIGYKNKTVNISGKQQSVDLGRIVLSSAVSQLKEVAVTAVKPLMKQEADRISYDVQADPDSKSLTALDMMRKVPLLSVDATDNIKLRGESNYKILINGKESALMARNPSDILKAMPGINIVKIEVITTPPAKYDAEGLAGIINIITKKNADQGYNGSVNTNYNSVYGYRLNLNATVKEGKFGVNGYVGTGQKPYNGSDFGNESTFFAPVSSSLLQNGTYYNGNKNTYANAELSYELDTLNLITATIDNYNGTRTTGNEQFTTAHNGNGLIAQAYHTLNTGSGDFKGADFGINYQLGFKRNKDELLTVSYKFNNSDNKQFNDIGTDQRLNYSSPNFRQYNSSGAKEHFTQIDFIDPIKKLTVEAGGKMVLRNNYSNFQNDTLNAAGSQYNTDPRQTNNFTYHQDVYGLYNSYQLKLTKWTFKAGLRLERTAITADFSSVGSHVDQQYNNLIPSFSMMRNLKNSSITFGFTQRIQRPGIGQLNPFADMSNPRYISVGNPALRPAINNNFELGYGNFAKGSINISTHYSFVNNAIENVQFIDANAVTTSTYANVGKHQNLGIDVNINYPLTKKLNVNMNTELLRVWLKGTYNGQFYTNSGQQGHVFTFANYKFDDGYRIGINLGFDSRYVLLQGVDNWYFGNGASVSKDIFKSKATISFNVNNPTAKFNKLDFFTKTADFENYNYNMNYYRTFNLNFSYKFGRLNKEIKKNQRGINNDDAAGGRN